MREIAMDALIYAYPLVMLGDDPPRQTNVEMANAVGQAPMNQFSHIATFPDPTFTMVVRPNADTLYSMLFSTSAVSRLSSTSRTRAAGTFYRADRRMDRCFRVARRAHDGYGGQRFALVGPGWSGATPAGSGIIQKPNLDRHRSSAGRRRTGRATMPTSTSFSADSTAIPLSQSGSAYTPAKRHRESRLGSRISRQSSRSIT